VHAGFYFGIPSTPRASPLGACPPSLLDNQLLGPPAASRAHTPCFLPSITPTHPCPSVGPVLQAMLLLLLVLHVIWCVCVWSVCACSANFAAAFLTLCCCCGGGGGHAVFAAEAFVSDIPVGCVPRTHLFLRILWRIATESSGDASRKEYEGGSESEDEQEAEAPCPTSTPSETGVTSNKRKAE
jgi:hypothetical protein